MTRARILQEVATTEAGTAFVPWIGTDLADGLCVQEDRVVANDNTVRYQGKSLQIRQTDTGSIMWKSPCGSMNTPMARWPSSMAHGAWRGISRMGG